MGAFLWLVVRTTVTFSLFDFSTSVPCDVTCTRGQRCYKERCSPCPKGYFQDSPIHQDTECKRWTYKAPYLNFVIKTPGSFTKDVEWACKDGYVLFEYTPFEYECRKATPAPPTTTIIYSTRNATTENTTLYELTTSAPPPLLDEPKPRLAVEKWVAVTVLCISGPIVVIVMIVIILLKRRHHKRNRNWNPSSFACELSPDQKSVPQYNFIYFSEIIYKLGGDSEKFVCHLKDPSGTFFAGSAIYFYKAEGGKVEDAYTKACLQWANKNDGDTHIEKYIINALRDIGREDVIEAITGTDKTNDCESPLLPSKKPKSQFHFFHRLVTALGAEDSEKLLYRLPNKNQAFNARQSLEFKKSEGSSSREMCLIKTFVDWERANPKMSNWPHCLLELLAELERNDVKEDFQIILYSDELNC